MLALVNALPSMQKTIIKNFLTQNIMFFSKPLCYPVDCQYKTEELSANILSLVFSLTVSHMFNSAHPTWTYQIQMSDCSIRLIFTYELQSKVVKDK